MASFADKMSAEIDVRRAWEELGVDAAELRALQEPIKQTYRDNPESARVPVRAEARLGNECTCTVKSWAGNTVAGLHPAAGGEAV